VLVSERRDICLKCDEKWERGPERRATCPRCGDSEWGQEFDLERYVGQGNEYRIMAEHADSESLVVWLDLQPLPGGAATRVPLCHRLKNSYRHITREHAKPAVHNIRFFKEGDRWKFALSTYPR
jgi:hypothetical protein